MSTQMTTTAYFTAEQRGHIETLRRDLTRRTQRVVKTEYGATDCGQRWAALCVETLPAGARAEPGALVSILAGAGVSGGAAVMAFDGSTVADASAFPEAVKAAPFAGMRAWRAMTGPRSTGF